MVFSKKLVVSDDKIRLFYPDSMQPRYLNPHCGLLLWIISVFQPLTAGNSVKIRVHKFMRGGFCKGKSMLSNSTVFVFMFACGGLT